MEEKINSKICDDIKSLELSLQNVKKNIDQIDEVDCKLRSLKMKQEEILEILNDSWKGERATRFQNKNSEVIQNVYNSVKKKNVEYKDKLLEHQKKLNIKKQELEDKLKEEKVKNESKDDR